VTGSRDTFHIFSYSSGVFVAVEALDYLIPVDVQTWSSPCTDEGRQPLFQLREDSAHQTLETLFPLEDLLGQGGSGNVGRLILGLPIVDIFWFLPRGAGLF